MKYWSTATGGLGKTLPGGFQPEASLCSPERRAASLPALTAEFRKEECLSRPWNANASDRRDRKDRTKRLRRSRSTHEKER